MAELAMLMTNSGRLTHQVIIRPASSQVQDRESLPAETTSVLPTLLHFSLCCSFMYSIVRFSLLSMQHLKYSLLVMFNHHS